MQFLPVFHPCFPHCTKFTAKQQKNLIADVQHGPFFRETRLSMRCDSIPSVRVVSVLFPHFGLDPVFFPAQLSTMSTGWQQRWAEPSRPVSPWSRPNQLIKTDKASGTVLPAGRWTRKALSLSIQCWWCHILFFFFFNLVFRCNLTLSSLKLTH